MKPLKNFITEKLVDKYKCEDEKGIAILNYIVSDPYWHYNHGCSSETAKNPEDFTESQIKYLSKFIYEYGSTKLKSKYSSDSVAKELFLNENKTFEVESFKIIKRDYFNGGGSFGICIYDKEDKRIFVKVNKEPRFRGPY